MNIFYMWRPIGYVLIVWYVFIAVCRRCSWVQRVQITYPWQPDIARLCNCLLTVHKYLLFIESVFLGHGCVWGADLFRALYSQAVGGIWNDLWGLQWRSEGRMWDCTSGAGSVQSVRLVRLTDLGVWWPSSSPFELLWSAKPLLEGSLFRVGLWVPGPV